MLCPDGAALLHGPVARDKEPDSGSAKVATRARPGHPLHMCSLCSLSCAHSHVLTLTCSLCSLALCSLSRCSLCSLSCCSLCSISCCSLSHAHSAHSHSTHSHSAHSHAAHCSCCSPEQSDSLLTRTAHCRSSVSRPSKFSCCRSTSSCPEQSHSFLTWFQPRLLRSCVAKARGCGWRTTHEDCRIQCLS